VLAGLDVLPEATWFGEGTFRMATSRDAALGVLAGPNAPTAIFAASDESAFGVLLAAAQLGLRVPQDLSVVGIDDHPYAEAYGLTTVRQSPAEQGALAAAMLLADLGVGRRASLQPPAPFTLVVRSSTAPPPE
jgi:DNA-binding LacI/PurR family transcriptional regulator